MNVTDDRYKKIMTDLGMPNSNSLLLALKQVANETAKEIFKTWQRNPLRRFDTNDVAQLTAKCNWYYCDGARLEREIEALKAELKAINTALDDPRTDLTMTACEVIVALKEQVAQLQELNENHAFNAKYFKERSDGTI